MGEWTEGHIVATLRGILKAERPWTNCKSEDGTFCTCAVLGCLLDKRPRHPVWLRLPIQRPKIIWSYNNGLVLVDWKYQWATKNKTWTNESGLNVDNRSHCFVWELIPFLMNFAFFVGITRLYSYAIMFSFRLLFLHCVNIALHHH